MARAFLVLLLSLLALGMSAAAHADLFGDDQARSAILDLRRRLDQLVLSQNRLVEENSQLRRSMMELQQQIDSYKDALANQRGSGEQIQQQISTLQKVVSDLQQQVNFFKANMASPAAAPGAPPPGDNGPNSPQAAFLPPPQSGVTAPLAGGPPGLPFIPPAPPVAVTPPTATVAEQRDFDAALTQFRGGNFASSQKSFAKFINQYPRSPLALDSLYWLGNAQYATRNYKEAISNFRSLLSVAPQHEKAAEAMLSIANCQTELKDTKAARATLTQLTKNYPQSEAAAAAKERLTTLK